MGLDMYLYKCKKISDDVLKTINGICFNNLTPPYLAFEKETEEESSCSALIPLSREVNMIKEVIDFDKIKSDYGLAPNADIVGKDFFGDKTRFSFSDGKKITLTDDEIHLKYTVKKNDAFYVTEAEEIGYWRKANQIHGWFDENLGGVENCYYYLVTEAQLQNLLEICRDILDIAILYPDEDGNLVIQNQKQIEEILPTTTGFFFGSEQYDQYYLDDVKNTINILKNALEYTDFEKEAIFYYAWW